MKRITLDCNPLETRLELHDLLAEALDFPAYYGKNLDALYDCLMELPEGVHLTFQNFFQLPFPVGGFQSVFEDAAADNPLFSFDIM